MKLDVYICDKCGVRDEGGRETFPLTTTFSSLTNGNFGTRHLCNSCRIDFEHYFCKFFKFYENIKNETTEK